MSFDYRVHIRDPKTGQVVRKQPYRMKVERNKPTKLTRDGVVYAENGEILEELKGDAFSKSPKSERIAKDFNEYKEELEKDVRARIEATVRVEVEEKIRKEVEAELAKE